MTVAPRRWWLCFALCASGVAQANVDIDIKIDGGTQQMQDNVRAFLSLTRYAKRDDLEQDTLERLEARIPLEVASALEPLGYYESEATYQTERRKPDKAEWKVTINVTPGRAVRLSEVNIDVSGPGKDDERIVEELGKEALRAGRRLDHGEYEAVKANLLHQANSSGYLNAHWTTSDLLIDKEERRAYVTLKMDTGERYYFGAITIEQNVIDADKMQRLLRMQEGDPYNLDLLLQTQYVLDDTQYFSPAEVVGGEPAPVTHTVPIKITAKPNRKNSYAIAAGYGTDTQARGSLTWDRRLVNRDGHRAKLQLEGSAIGYDASVRYVIPVRDVALEKLEFTLSKIKEKLADNISYREEFTPSLTQVMGSWQRVLFTRLSHEKSVYYDENYVVTDTVNTSLIVPGISYSTLPTYILGQTQRKYSLYAELSGSPSTLGSGASYLRLYLEGEKVFDLSQRWHLRLRGQLGAIHTHDLNEFIKVPISARFFAGGDNSVRGFSLNELSPVDTNKDGIYDTTDFTAPGTKVGARKLLVGTVEFERDLPKNLRAAVFYDIGNAVDSFTDRLEDSAGVGLRWHISVASLGLDVAQPLSVGGRTPRLHLHISTLF
jgi:translocation and assembly module TamA